jgi:copper(I)-binding protein
MVVLATFLISSGAIAGDIMVDDAYARSSGKMAKAGAAFMTLHNHADRDDRLISVSSDAAKMVQLHTHLQSDDGVMKMRHVPEGFLVPANGMHMLIRGKNHVMFMGLTAPWEHGQSIPLKLIFENAGEIDIQVPIDLERKDTAHSH